MSPERFGVNRHARAPTIRSLAICGVLLVSPRFLINDRAVLRSRDQRSTGGQRVGYSTRLGHKMRMRTSRTRMGDTALAIRRVGSHLTRSTAVWGYVLGATCGLVYLVSPESWPATDSIRQFTLVLFAVAVGAIVLPDLPSNLWSVDVEKVRNLIPQLQRERLAKTLIRAESDNERWNELVWTKALSPLLQASREPWRYVLDMNYQVAIHPRRSLVLGTTPVAVHTVQSEQRSSRVLINTSSPIHLSIARTSMALNSEFDFRGCIARELVPLGGLIGAAWQEAIQQVCEVELSVDGVDIDLKVDAGPEAPDVVRWLTPSDWEPPESWARVVIRFHFHVEDSVNTFPVFFSGYYCAGTTDVSLKLFDGSESSELACDFFVAHALGDDTSLGKRLTSDGIYKHAAFSTGRDTILWPGSGVLFNWHLPEEASRNV